MCPLTEKLATIGALLFFGHRVATWSASPRDKVLGRSCGLGHFDVFTVTLKVKKKILRVEGSVSRLPTQMLGLIVPPGDCMHR